MCSVHWLIENVEYWKVFREPAGFRRKLSPAFLADPEANVTNDPATEALLQFSEDIDL